MLTTIAPNSLNLLTTTLVPEETLSSDSPMLTTLCAIYSSITLTICPNALETRSFEAVFEVRFEIALDSEGLEAVREVREGTRKIALDTGGLEVVREVRE